MTLIFICQSEIREINTSQAIECMQAWARGYCKTINTDFKQNSTPFVLSISQRISEGRIGPPTHPDQIRVGQNTARTLSQAISAWLRPLSNIISHTLFQLSMNRVLWNRWKNFHLIWHKIGKCHWNNKKHADACSRCFRFVVLEDNETINCNNQWADEIKKMLSMVILRG